MKQISEHSFRKKKHLTLETAFLQMRKAKTSIGVSIVQMCGSHPRTENYPLRTGFEKLELGTAC